jgi:hypothetical protein
MSMMTPSAFAQVRGAENVDSNKEHIWAPAAGEITTSYVPGMNTQYLSSDK